MSRRFIRPAGVVLGGILCVAASAAPAVAQQWSAEDELAVLRGRFLILEESMAEQSVRHQEQYEELRLQNEVQRQEIDQLKAMVVALTSNGTHQASKPSQSAPASRPTQVAANRPAQNRPATPPQPRPRPTPQQAQPATQPAASAATQATDVPDAVGERPSEEQRQPRIELFSDRGGILTPRGGFVVDSSLRYSTTSDNRFFFSGVEIVDALLIGVIQARDTERSSLSFNQGFRYGITSRLEVDFSVPFITQEDRRTDADVSSTDGTSALRTLEASGVGDISAGLHYQLNQGQKWPYIIANLRAKAPTGEGPFDVGFDEDGNPAGASTGSGYWSFEPSLTFIKRIDPVALFGNVGYQFNLETDVDQMIGDVLYHTIDPGDAIRTSFGIGIALNEKVNLNFGYDQSYILASETTLERDDDGTLIMQSFEGEEATVGSFLFGIGYRPAPKVGLSITTTLGATDEAPDVNLSLRGQYRF